MILDRVCSVFVLVCLKRPFLLNFTFIWRLHTAGDWILYLLSGHSAITHVDVQFTEVMYIVCLWSKLGFRRASHFPYTGIVAEMAPQYGGWEGEEIYDQRNSSNSPLPTWMVSISHSTSLRWPTQFTSRGQRLAALERANLFRPVELKHVKKEVMSGFSVFSSSWHSSYRNPFVKYKQQLCAAWWNNFVMV